MHFHKKKILLLFNDNSFANVLYLSLHAREFFMILFSSADVL